MKLPAKPLPATLRDMKLQGVKPLTPPLRRLTKKLTKKLISLGPIQVSRASSGGQSAAESTRSLIDKTENKRAKLFLNLLLVRPWILVLGLWLFSMMVGSLALGGMLSPRKLTQALPEPTVTESSQTGDLAINVEKDADELAIEGAAAVDDASGEGAVTTADSRSGFPLLPLGVLVSSCAAGSLLLSRRRAMMRMSAARAKGRVRQGRHLSSRQPVKTQLKSQSAPTKKRRQRVRRNAVAARKNGQLGQKSHVLASRTNAQPHPQLSGVHKGATSKKQSLKKVKQKLSPKKSLTARAQANRVQAKRVARGAGGGAKRRVNRAAMRAASRRQPMVSVVPASERHALDWTQGSLAHQMDVRHQRRAM